MDGDTIVVGAYAHSATTGAAYVFTKPTVASWASTSTAAKLTAPNGVSGDYFGDGVSVDGETVVV